MTVHPAALAQTIKAAAEPGYVRVANLEIERARMAGAMRALAEQGGLSALRAAMDAEFSRLARIYPNGDWIG